MIYKLERENTALIAIKQLPRLWKSINHLVLQLEKTDRTYYTTELMDLKNSFINNYTLLNTFNTNHSVWFTERYPEFAIALSGAITSLQNINDVIVNGLQNYYWDAEFDVPVITDISQVHRNILANAIKVELEG